MRGNATNAAAELCSSRELLDDAAVRDGLPNPLGRRSEPPKRTHHCLLALAPKEGSATLAQWDG
jgi:hypothetical protein